MGDDFFDFQMIATMQFSKPLCVDDQWFVRPGVRNHAAWLIQRFECGKAKVIVEGCEKNSWRLFVAGACPKAVKCCRTLWQSMATIHRRTTYKKIEMSVNDNLILDIQETKTILGFVFALNRLVRWCTKISSLKKFNPMVILTCLLILLLVFGNKALKEAWKPAGRRPLLKTIPTSECRPKKSNNLKLSRIFPERRNSGFLFPHRLPPVVPCGRYSVVWVNLAYNGLIASFLKAFNV